MKNVLYIFAGSRGKLVAEVKEGIAPDTQLYGMNHLPADVHVGMKEFAETKFGKFFGRLVGFRLRHALMYFTARSADVVFGSAILYMMPLKRIFGAKGKFVLFNISLNRFLNKNARRWPFIKKNLGAIDAIVSLSHVQMDELKNKYEIPAEKLEFVPLGMDTKFYQPVFEGRQDFILSVGRDNGRDYKTVINVAKQLPHKRFELILSKRNLKGIESIPANVKIFFDISKAELKKKYAEAAMLILATHADGHRDGADCSGQTVLLDAFASGLPVIATTKAYISDYAEDGREVALVPPYDDAGIIKAIHEMPFKEKDLARNARVRVEREFSTAKMGERLGNLFKRL